MLIRKHLEKDSDKYIELDNKKLIGELHERIVFEHRK